MIADPDFGIIGYTDRWSYRPGETVSLHLSAKTAGLGRASLHRFRQYVPQNPGFELILDAIDGADAHFEVVPQQTRIGSYFEADLPLEHEPHSGLALAVMVRPTAVGAEGNGLFSLTAGDAALSLSIHPGGLLRARFKGDGAPVAETWSEVLAVNAWQALTVHFNPQAERLEICVRRGGELRNYAMALPAGFPAGAAKLTLAAAECSSLPSFNGRLEAPLLCKDGADARSMLARLDAFLDGAVPSEGVMAAWDFSRQMDSAVIADCGPHGCDGRLVNLPMRAVKGVRWSGGEQSWKHAPRDYASIHFHQDDLLDANWPAATTLALPDSLASGLYLIEVAGDAGRDVLPIFVTPKVRGRRSKLAFVAPTFSYLAYANDRCLLHGANPEVLANRMLVLTEGDCALAAHPEFGLSLYDTHVDGSGVSYASRRRPCLTFRHSQRAWQGGIGSGLWNFSADLLILSWLDREGLEYEIVCDDQLDAEGSGALGAYDCVLTGSHPEYHTANSHDAFSGFLAQGGRLIYFGGNGFYWRVSTHADYPGTIELRRAEDGNRSWASEPGEYYHAFDGAYGGLWRRNGRPPQHLVGVGYTGQGFFRCHPYRFTGDCQIDRVGFLFDGDPPQAETLLGDFGQIGGGAAGIEIDRADTRLGTPEHALVIASCSAFDDSYVLANEEVLVNRPTVVGRLSPLLRCDLVFFETPAGGAVLSTGSVAWAGSLGDLPADNDIARLTRRAVDRFLDAAPFSVPHQPSPQSGK
ncbi:N,N-dimethylformamidase beta subunit family domain-containing protein [Pseudohoeflea coraliihabitans]|uniref:N,N-dimethylformamidase beta subunit-like C-terminal domain-containing protein n=1 Tax=Pseudohoeflea coraliihabitans TaxID=2860393 RepID=A0ABS6WL10_9HYPH|nr:N,N-dimethylformamidase beta subunit family domain-containing protein [Pseudohoeflea sp. DP4N28-3]MBW3096641.1 hypothetical protein [Pseudohoeflea sp. DP4N28-3]